jgi:Protein of unknown function (DUF3035)
VSIGTVMVVSACAQGSVQEALGMGKRSPDEFAVVSRAPLILPPDYGLRPPRPGESRPGVDTPSEQARASLVRPAQPAPAGEADGASEVLAAAFDQPSATESQGEQALVAEATRTPSDPDIRHKIAADNVKLAQVEQDLFTRLVKWRQPSTLATVVDPAAETQRLRANASQGKPATEGESPVITQRRQSVLQGFLSEVF